MNEKLAAVIDHFFENWKSTAANALTLITMTSGYFAMIPVEQLQANGITQKEMFWFTVTSGLAKMYVAVITKDNK